ncbi:MAG TPA: sigma-70 family RNA polymerase sigma factor [Hanamia sp.]
MKQVNPDEDHLLWQRIGEGSVESFTRLYDKYWSEVYNSAMKRLRDTGRAQDIAQDVFVTLWMRREELQIRNFPAYLYMAVRNKVLNLFEKEKRYVPIEYLLENNIRAYGNQADAVALRNEFLQAYKNLVDSLPSQQKKIFHLFYDEDLSTEEIAEQLQLTRKTIQNQLSRSVSFLKANLTHLFLLCILFLPKD